MKSWISLFYTFPLKSFNVTSIFIYWICHHHCDHWERVFWGVEDPNLRQVGRVGFWEYVQSPNFTANIYISKYSANIIYTLVGSAINQIQQRRESWDSFHELYLPFPPPFPLQSETNLFPQFYDTIAKNLGPVLIFFVKGFREHPKITLYLKGGGGWVLAQKV